MTSTKRISIVTVALILACAAIPAMAQRSRTSKSGDPAAKLIKKFNSTVQPTPEQQKKLAPLWSQYRKDTAVWQATNKAKVTELKRQMSVKGKQQYAKQQLAILYSGKQKINRSLLSKMNGVLTSAQRPKAEQVLDPKKSAATPGSKSLQKLGLTGEQMTQANTIMNEAKVQANKTDDPAVKDAIMRDAMARVRNSVMTDEQKAAWDATQKRPTIRRQRRDDGEKKEQASEGKTPEKKKEGRSRRGWGGVELTEEQQKQMTAIRAKMSEAMKSAETREEKMAVWREMGQEMKDVFTDEQKEQMAAARDKAIKEVADRMMTAIEATDEQREAATEIMADARKAAEETDDWSEKRKIYRETFETLKKEVFTEEQVKKMEEKRAEMRKNWRGRRRGGRRGGGDRKEGEGRGGKREDRDKDSDTE
jgi:hypothetical protein